MHLLPQAIRPTHLPWTRRLNVATTAVAVARVRSARAARVVTMARAVDLALNDDAVAVVAVVARDKESEHGGNEEEDAVPVHARLALLFHCSGGLLT